ncbi:hypothetical protein EDB87DRAFT_1686583 [Lactarius vividus]|nr:hypothetical protein EDB87DRAFT_1686583 [Lactarius vividus]
MEFSDIAIHIMQVTVFVLTLYFALLHLEIHLATIMETTSNYDDVNERYRVIAPPPPPPNRPYPSHVYAEFVDEKVDVDSSGGGQRQTTSSAHLEDDAVSTLSELTELSESGAPRDGEEESEEEVPLAEIHRLGKKNSLGSSPRTQAQPTSPGSSVSYTTFQTVDGVDVYSQKVRGTKDAMYNVFESIGNAEAVTPPFLPKYLVVPLDLYIHW